MEKEEALRYYMEVTQGVEKNTSDAFRAGYDAGKEDALENRLPPCATLLDHQLLRACDVVGVTVEEVKVKRRDRELVLARQLYFYLASLHTSSTYEEIAELVGMDHSSVSYHISKVKEYIDTNDKLFMKHYARL